jgi:hypothetical protein
MEHLGSGGDRVDGSSGSMELGSGSATAPDARAAADLQLGKVRHTCMLI